MPIKFTIPISISEDDQKPRYMGKLVFYNAIYVLYLSQCVQRTGVPDVVSSRMSLKMILKKEQ
jgi:hypothetical protein